MKLEKGYGTLTDMNLLRIGENQQDAFKDYFDEYATISKGLNAPCLVSLCLQF